MDSRHYVTGRAPCHQVSWQLACAGLALALLIFSVTLPLFSQLYLTFHDALRTLPPNVPSIFANSIRLLFSVLMSHGWFKHGVLDPLRDLQD